MRHDQNLLRHAAGARGNHRGGRELMPALRTVIFLPLIAGVELAGIGFIPQRGKLLLQIVSGHQLSRTTTHAARKISGDVPDLLFGKLTRWRGQGQRGNECAQQNCRDPQAEGTKHSASFFTLSGSQQACGPGLLMPRALYPFCSASWLAESGAAERESTHAHLSLALICFCGRRRGPECVSLFTKKPLNFIC